VDIVEYALKMEKDGEVYYRKLSEQTDNTGMKQIFDMLAEAEVEHYQTFLNIKNNQPVPPRDDTILARVKNVFQQMHDNGNWQDISSDQADAYKQARDVEKKSQEFYLEKAEELSDPEQKELCRQIAEEERKHYLIMDNLLEMVSHPSAWMESAEWRHLDEF
jgi:rubrerythrin